MEQLLQVGIITTTHGLKGEVKVYPTTQTPKRFEELSEVYLDTGRERVPLAIESVRYFKNQVILKFKGYDHINDIEKYKQCSLWIDREKGTPLNEDEYYIADLIDMNVYLEDGSLFGELTDVMETGANDVYVIQSLEHGEVLVPAIKDCIKQVDVEDKKMIIHLLDGLLS